MNVSVSGYTVLERIHDGARSRVYRGVRQADGKPVIIKVHRQEYPSFTELGHYRNHYTITRDLDVPGVDRPLALESHGNGFALIMEDTGRVSLRSHARRASLGPVEVLEIAAALARILEELHARRIVHKDIKPDNIIIHPETLAVALIDFGIATLLPRESREPQRLNVLEGTLAYISPEQTGRMNRAIDYRSDHYSLGVTLYELSTSQLPFQSSDPVELIHCHLARQPVPPAELNPALPAPLSDVIMKLMAKPAEARYQSAAGLRHDLEICLEQCRRTGAVAPFPLAQRDVSERFIILEKLYGREAEVAALLAGFERVSEGATELMLVSGYSGIGKSALVNEVHRPIVRRHGYFAAGKFDQLKRNIPFSSLVQAFRDLLRQVLTEQSERVGAWRAKLLAALGSEGQVIAELIPELELLIGKQPPVPELPPADTQERWGRVFLRFIRVFADAEHPLVVFLDDLQWADAASLKLLEHLLGDQETRCLLLLGAYRDNEVGPAHPFTLTLERLLQGRRRITQVSLRPLALPDLNLLVAETLRQPPEQALDLTELVLRRTAGNPFFSSQYLKSLHQEGLIGFDPASGRFRYDLAMARAASARSDVVEFMADQLQKLPARTQAVLKLAAVIGNRFDLGTLAIVREQTQGEAAADLWPALQEGLVLPLDDAYRAFQRHEHRADDVLAFAPAREEVTYRFLHDRVQQAAYSLIPEAEVPATHLAVGRLLLSHASPEAREERMFDIVNQLDAGAELISDPAERAHLAELNLTAGRKAKASTAYASAARYLAAGMDLLGPDRWARAYDLTAAFHRERAEVEYLEGNFEVSEALVRAAIEHARTPVEKAETFIALIVQYTLRARYPEAIQAGREALALVGIDVPTQDFQAVRDAEMAEVLALIGDRPIASLYDLPDMTLPDKRVAMKILTTMGPPTYRSHPALWSVLCSKAVGLCLRHGNAPQVAYSHTSFGGLLGYVMSDYRRGAELGDVALRLGKKYHNPSDQSVTYLMVGSSLRHWSQHLRRASEDYHEAYSIGLESGNLQYAAYAFGHNMYCRFYQGVNLEQLLTEIAGYLTFSRRRKNQWAIDLLEGGRLVALNLGGATAGPTDFSSAELTEERFLEDCRAHRNGQVLCIYGIMKSRALYLQGRLAEALACCREAEESIAAVATQGLLPSAQHRITESLILTALYPGAGEEERARLWQRLEANHAKLGIWAESCAENFRHHHLLVGAEMARLEGRHAEAVDRYDGAIEAAQKGQFVQDAALANELAARCWLARGKDRIARHYLREAYHGYACWGAVAKQRRLEEEHPELLEMAGTGARARVTVEGTLSARSSWEELDLSAVIKSSEAIFSEIVLERLLCTLLRIAIENAGAERGFIVMPKDGALVIAAASGRDGGVAALPGGAPLAGSEELCEALVRYVARTGEPVVHDDMTAAPAYAADPYVIARRPRSVLCVPTSNHGRLVSVVYLENNLSERCFTPARLEIAKILSTQAAIALDNALLYADLERASERLESDVAQRTEELRGRTEELRALNARLQRELAERERVERERAALQEMIIAAQRERIAELSTPIIPITQEIVVMPLIGTVDAERAQCVRREALAGVERSGAKVLILDITGMRHIDGSVASTIVRTGSALRLLGAEVVLTGVRPALAEALVELEVELAGMVTRNTLESGIAYAMRRIADGG